MTETNKNIPEKGYSADLLGELLESEPPAMLRIWKLGNSEHGLSKETLDALVDKLQKRLDGWDHKSDFDLVWDADIELIQIPVYGQDLGDVVDIERAKEMWNVPCPIVDIERAGND